MKIAIAYINGFPIVGRTKIPPCGARSVQLNAIDNPPAVAEPIIQEGITLNGSFALNLQDNQSSPLLTAYRLAVQYCFPFNLERICLKHTLESFCFLFTNFKKFFFFYCFICENLFRICTLSWYIIFVNIFFIKIISISDMHKKRAKFLTIITINNFTPEYVWKII